MRAPRRSDRRGCSRRPTAAARWRGRSRSAPAPSPRRPARWRGGRRDRGRPAASASAASFGRPSRTASKRHFRARPGPSARTRGSCSGTVAAMVGERSRTAGSSGDAQADAAVATAPATAARRAGRMRSRRACGFDAARRDRWHARGRDRIRAPSRPASRDRRAAGVEGGGLIRIIFGCAESRPAAPLLRRGVPWRGTCACVRRLRRRGRRARAPFRRLSRPKRRRSGSASGAVAVAGGRGSGRARRGRRRRRLGRRRQRSRRCRRGTEPRSWSCRAR